MRSRYAQPRMRGTAFRRAAAGLTVLAAAFVAAQDDDADTRPATELEDAPVVPQTKLEDAPVVPQTDLEDAAVVPQTDLEDAPVAAQTDLEDAPVVPQTVVEEVIVTGSRLARNPNELAGNLLVLDRDFIEATGEATLERVLRQLPQNLNATAERVGSDLNGALNFSGGSTVNLRGLGSESTLILVDGKRIGHSGFLGGVTDVSAIPLSMVERVEVMLDGASAVYGSDAVGGVVNVITRKDYEGVEVDLNYNWPAEGGYGEWRGAVSGSLELGGTRLRASVTHGRHSGLDGTEREATIFERAIFPGPQYDIRFCCGPGGVAFPVLYRLDGNVLTLPEYQALSDEDRMRATEVTHAVLPEGFNANSSLDEITQFGLPDWGIETQAGFHTLPESTRNGGFLGVERDLGDWLTVGAHVRLEQRETTYKRGYISFSGQTLAQNNPFNPFDRAVHLRGQRRDMGTGATLTETDTLDVGIDLDGSFGDSNWDWEADWGASSADSSTDRVNILDGVRLRAGMGSDGVTPVVQFLSGETAESCAAKGGRLNFGFCRVETPPPDPVNPFGDLSAYVQDTLTAGSVNEQMRLAALVRGRFALLPGGDARVLLGASRHTTSLDSATEFQLIAGPLGSLTSLDTRAERSNKAAFAEALVPVFDRGTQSLDLSVSVRWDSYDAPEVVYAEGDMAEKAEGLPATGDASTWGVGLIFAPRDNARLRMSRQTAFVAPQLNQVLLRPSQRMATGFSCIRLRQPDGSLACAANALIRQGGNPDLKPETAQTSNMGLEVLPASLPGLSLKTTWSRTRYANRITQIRAPIIDPEMLPSNTVYDAEQELYIQDQRWINASHVIREGLDHEVGFERSTDVGDIDLQVRYSRTLHYDVTVDPAIDSPVSVLRIATARTPIGVVSPSATTAQFSWTHRGLRVGLDLERRAKTTTMITNVTNVYTPASVLDLRLTYTFAAGGLLPTPAWAEGSRVTFTVNNLTNAYGKTRVTNAAGAALEQTQSDRSSLYGRVLNMSLHMVF